MSVGAATSALLIGGGIYSAASSVQSGNAQAKNIQRQAEYNAQVYEQQAAMVLEKKKIQDVQFIRQAAQARGTIISKTAGKGFNLGGSPLAILIDNETQMQFDKAIEDYNLNVEANYATSAAQNTRATGEAQARLAKHTGYSNAFSTLLNTGVTYGMMNLGKQNPLVKKTSIDQVRGQRTYRGGGA